MNLRQRSHWSILLALLGALLLPVGGALFGRVVTLWPIGSAWTTITMVFGGAVLGLALAPLRLPHAILAAGLVQQGLMAFMLFGQPPMASSDSDPEAYFHLPWLVLIQVPYAAAFIMPGLTARWALHRRWPAREPPGPHDSANLGLRKAD